MDPLSDVLRAVRLTGAIFFDIDASEPWVAQTPSGDAIVDRIFPGAEHLIPYHVVTHGACWGGLLDEPPIQLAAGDIIVFPRGDRTSCPARPACARRQTSRSTARLATANCLSRCHGNRP